MNYEIAEVYRIKCGTDSKGCQAKYFKDNYWYKLDGSSNEGKNEHVVSLILQCSSLNTNDYVYYEFCTVNGKMACRSLNFLLENEILITLNDIICNMYETENAYNIVWGKSLDIRERFEIIVNVVGEYSSGKLDISEYLSRLMYLDLLVLNRDRHYGNIAIIVNRNTHEYRTAPIFDNGLSLLGGCQGMVFENGLEYAIEYQNARTISGSFTQQVMATSKDNSLQLSPFKVDVDKLYELIEVDKYVTNFQKQVLDFQFKQYGKLFIG